MIAMVTLTIELDVPEGLKDNEMVAWARRGAGVLVDSHVEVLEDEDDD